MLSTAHFLMFVVLRIETIENETDSAVFKKILPTRDRAIQEIEADALEHFNNLVDPNDGDTHVFPGVTALSADDYEYADDNYPDHNIVYKIVEMEIEK